MDDSEVVSRQLRRHAMRRRDAVPTLSILLGDAQALTARLSAFYRRSGTGLLVLDDMPLAQLAEAWVRAASSSHDLVTRALLAATGEHAGGARVRAAWQARSVSERTEWLEQLAAQATASVAFNAARWLAAHVHDAHDADARDDAVEMLRCLAAWLPAAEWPALCVIVQEAIHLERLSALSCRVPALPILAVLRPEAWREGLASVEPRTRAFLPEGLIEMGRDTSGAGSQVFAVPPARLQHEPTELVDLRARAEEARAYAHHAQRLGTRDADDARERARGLAELLLYELLQREPDTRGEFARHGTVGSTIESGLSEVDLLSVPLKLAVEVDGSYHLTAAATYRHDRRKDVHLQTEGFWVSRYLADDVVDDARAVVGSIRDLVIKRRAQLG